MNILSEWLPVHSEVFYCCYYLIKHAYQMEILTIKSYMVYIKNFSKPTE